MKNYVLATIKDWNIKEFEKRREGLPGNWFLISDPKELISEKIKKINPEYIFFPHWSWIVPSDLVNNYTCVCFHMTDLPFGRGGSPLQNLISRNITETKISALKMTEELDAGPIYLKKKLGLDGRAQEIYERSAGIIFDMIKEMITHDIEGQPQVGEPTLFKRRTPDESEISGNLNLDQLYNFIRMLDAETYPLAFLKKGDLKFFFKNAKLMDGKLTGEFFVKMDGKDGN